MAEAETHASNFRILLFMTNSQRVCVLTECYGPRSALDCTCQYTAEDLHAAGTADRPALPAPLRDLEDDEDDDEQAGDGRRHG